ncbi:MAG TPA: hypothetical protein VG603_00910 [Chitinophagales bacterium]|nr:hypothetical protein [Chitinophagales bacterium]
MDRPNEPLYQIMNESLKQVSKKIEKDYYKLFVEWPDKGEERKELEGKDAENYTALVNVFDAACWAIHDIAYVQNGVLDIYLDYRFKELKKAVSELRGKINGENFTKEEASSIQEIMLQVFKKDRVLEIAKKRSKQIATVIEYERGLVNEHSVFNKVYWALREITEENPA